MYSKNHNIRVEHPHVPDARPINYVTSDPLKEPSWYHYSHNIDALKMLIIGIIVGLLFAILIGGVWYTTNLQNEAASTDVPVVFNAVPTPTPSTVAVIANTSNWKTYLGKNFKFKYPETYTSSPNEKPFKTFIEEVPDSISIKSRQEGNEWTFTIIEIRMNKKQFYNFATLSICDTNKVPGTNQGVTPCTKEVPKEIMIGNKRAKTLNIQTADTINSYTIQTEEEPLMEISSGGGYSAPLTLFKQILSTFTFTNLSPTPVQTN